MVNDPLRARGRASHRASGRAKGEVRGQAMPHLQEAGMAKSKPLMAESFGTDHANEAVQSALRTLDAEAGGIAAIAAALQDSLGAAFAAAVDLIRSAQGRVIVT